MAQLNGPELECCVAELLKSCKLSLGTSPENVIVKYAHTWVQQKTLWDYNVHSSGLKVVEVESDEPLSSLVIVKDSSSAEQYVSQSLSKPSVTNWLYGLHGSGKPKD